MKENFYMDKYLNISTKALILENIDESIYDYVISFSFRFSQKTSKRGTFQTVMLVNWKRTSKKYLWNFMLNI